MGSRITSGLVVAIALVAALPAVAQAKAGDILAAQDGSDDSVVRITKSGTQTTVASGSPLTSPSGLDFSTDGKIFEADYELPGIVAINPSTHSASNLNDDPGLFEEPLDLEFGPDRMMYVAEEGLGTIVQVDPRSGDASVFAPQGTLLDDPYALSVSPRGKSIFVADNDGQVLRVDGRTGAVSLVAEIPGSGPQGIEQTPKGLVYVMDEIGGIVYAIDPKTGSFEEAAQDDDLIGAYNIALEPAGTLVTDGGDGIVRVDPRSGSVTPVAGGEDTNAEGIAVEPPKCKGKLATIVGSQKKDKLKGSKFADVIVGLKGNDRINGGKGKDRICGGRGKDKLKGGKGKDKLSGGPGRDREKQ